MKQILAQLEDRLDPADPQGVRVLAYGEISAALLVPGLEGRVCKRMSGFADHAMAAAYGDQVTDHIDALRDNGGRVKDSKAVLRFYPLPDARALAKRASGPGAGVTDMTEIQMQDGMVVAMPKGTLHAWLPGGKKPLLALQMYVPPGPEQRFKKLAADAAAAAPPSR